MMNRLIAVRVLAHIERGHFCHLVNRVAVRSGPEGIGRRKHRVKLISKGLVAAHELYQSGYILHHTPRPMPRAAFRERATPFIGIKRLVPCTVRIASTYKPNAR